MINTNDNRVPSVKQTRRRDRKRAQLPQFSICGLLTLVTAAAFVLICIQGWGVKPVIATLAGGAVAISWCRLQRRYGVVLLGSPLAFGILNWRCFLIPYSEGVSRTATFSELVAAPLDCFILALSLSLMGSFVRFRYDPNANGLNRYSLRLHLSRSMECIALFSISLLLIASILPVWYASGRSGAWLTSFWESNFFATYD